MGDESGDLAAVEAADAAFYRAFEAVDIDAMSDVWLHGPEVECVHPGWPRIRGWAKVGGSWAQIFAGGQRLQFILSDQQIRVVGDMAIVTHDENLLGGGGPATTAAVNAYRRTGEGWKMVLHHASPVA